MLPNGVASKREAFALLQPALATMREALFLERGAHPDNADLVDTARRVREERK
jgi:hypothetical protein